MKPFIAGLLFLLASTGVSFAEKEKPPLFRRLSVYRTDVPPVLDGKLDDACWKEAEVADDFRIVENRTTPAALRSEVRVCYDAEYLYFHYLLHDEAMDHLEVGGPEDTRDVIDMHKDKVELFLDPGRTGKSYYQFIVTPLGARFDMRVTAEDKREVGTYTPEWDVVPHLGTDHWAVEFRIPIAELVFDGGHLGTPQPGEVWGINFIRGQGLKKKDWSFWSPTRDSSFHHPWLLGSVIFQGRRNGEASPRFRWREAELHYGRGNLSVETGEAGPKLVAQWHLTHERGEPQESPGGSGDTGVLETAYRIIDGGRWDAQVRVSDADGKTVFTGTSRRSLPPVRTVIGEIQDRLERAEKMALAHAELPEIAELGTKIGRIKARVAPMAAKLANPEALSLGGWEKLSARMPEIEAPWEALRYDIEVLGFHSPAGKEAPPLAWATVPPYTRVNPGSVFAPTPEPVRLQAAGGEWESFQIALMPFLRDVATVEATASPLTGKGTTLPASCVEVNVVGFVKMHEDRGGGEVPDVLYPARPVALAKGRTQPLWINVQVPPGTPAGVYRGEITLKAGDFSATVPLEVEAFGFDLPPKRSVAADAWYWIDSGRELRPYYGVKRLDLTPELYEKHLQMLSRYRMACYPTSSGLMWTLIRVYQEADGNLTFDFSGCDWIFELGKKYGAESFGASFGCNAQALYPTASAGVPIHDRATGKKISNLHDYAASRGWTFTRGKSVKSDFARNPAYSQFIRQLTVYLKEKGVMERAHYEIYDEPKTFTEWRDLIKMHGFLKNIAPELKLKSYGVGPWEYADQPEYSPLGKYDVWAPMIYRITPGRLRQLHERQRLGESFWFYTCSAKYRETDGATAPHICLYQPPLAPRMHGWAAWKLQADGFLIFAMATGLPTNTQSDPERFYTDPIWEVGKTAGQGYLVYPAPGLEYWPSLRLAAVRDGLEDYEYLKRLSDGLAKLDPARDADLVRRIGQELEVGEEIVSWDWHQWCKDEAILTAKRRRLAGLIGEAEAAIGGN